MPGPTECCLMIDPPAPGPWNMAVDEVLLEWAAEHGGCCWRLYRWSEPTLSLGYFQQYDARRQHAASRACPAVRRLTGGGAIVHDAEWTYSLVVPAGHALVQRRDLLYATVHTALIEALSNFGISAALCQDRAGRSSQDEPFLCFQRRAPGDVLVGRTKVAGSAQRRRRGAVLQHGSLLLRRSAAAPELGALEDLAGEAVPEDELAEAWLAELPRQLAVTWYRQSLSANQRHRATRLQEARYTSAAWTRHRGRPRESDAIRTFDSADD